jgi:Xaa-Pro dipeptidase
MHAAMRKALEAAHAILKPGAAIRDIFESYRRICARTGFADHRLTSCGCSLGTACHPTRMDWPWIHAGSDVVAAPTMVFYVHMILADRSEGLSMALADTSIVTATGSERLSKLPLDLVVKTA